MDTSLPEAEPEEQEATEAIQSYDASEYESPLASQPTMPEKHYNDGEATHTTGYKPKSTTKYINKCDVCNLKLNSYIQSKSHYVGKPHAKKVKKAKEDTEKAATPTAEEPPSKKVRMSPVANLYCGTCNLTFTSDVHAKDHYLGRNHSRMMHGLAPYTQGYYNNTTYKWQRDPPDPRVSAQLLSSEPPSDVEGKPAHQEKPKIRGKFSCEVCNISITCEDQLESHLAGLKHAKMVKRVASMESVAAGQGSDEVGDQSVDGNGQSPTTPATLPGPFQCETCRVSLNSETQYTQHMESKKHKMKVSPTTQQSPQAADKASKLMDQSSVHTNPPSPVGNSQHNTD